MNGISVLSKCVVCHKDLTTGDFNGICQSCREKGHSEFLYSSSTAPSAHAKLINKHEEARKHLIKLGNILSNYVEQPDELIDIEQYINECEATENKYKQLDRDVKRLLELYYCSEEDERYQEYIDLFDKLLKVGEKT